MKIELKRLRGVDLYPLTSIIKQDVANSAYLDWPFTRESANMFINEYNTWGIWLNGSILAGAIEVKENLETAYFVSEQFQNIGIATQAIILCKEYFGKQQLWCVINPDNKKSLRVAQKTGLRIKFIS